MTTYLEEEAFETQFNGRTVWRIIQQALPHWPYLVSFLALIAIASYFDGLFTFLTGRLIDEGILAADRAQTRRILTLYGLVSAGQATVVFGFIYFAGVLGHLVRYDVRQKLFDHLQSLSFSYFDRTPIGWIISRVTSDTDRLAEFVTWGLLDMFWGAGSVLVSIGFMFVINWRLALAVLFVVPLLLWVSIQFQRRILFEFRLVRKVNSKITGAYNENITGVRVTKSLGREERDLYDFQLLSSQMYRASFRASWLSALFLPIVQLISATGVAAVVWFGGLQISTGGMTIGDMQAFIGYMTFMLWPIQEMARVFAQMQQSIAAAERIFSLMDAVPDIQDSPDAVTAASLRGEIVFDHVGFGYEADNPVLKDFSLTIRQGEMIALVGPTGAGKSTIVNLLCRFYEPTGGQIRIDGRDYTTLTQHALQSRIGMVLQTPHLFSGTIRENIRYGRLDATDAEIEAAAEVAGAARFIERLEKGYEEPVGEGGSLLSVGQKQLLSLARAILADPDLVIMDEATSSVDTLTEALIQQGMNAVLDGRTSFVIAHRLSTIKRADRILVIEAGRIVEQGTHADLIRARGHYYNLYTRQFRREREDTAQLFDLAA